MPSPTSDVSARQYAALYVAAAWLRSELINIAAGEVDIERVKRLIEATETRRIEEALGLPRDSLFIDHHQHISEREKHIIGATGVEIDHEAKG